MIVLPPGIQIVEGITFYVMSDNQVRIYALRTFSSRAIDVWIDHVILGLAGCPLDQVYRVVYDLSDISLFALKAFRIYAIGSLGMSVSGQARVRAIMDEKPQMRVKLAILTHPTLSAWVLKNINGHQIDVPFKFFLSLNRANAWLANGNGDHD